GCGGGAGGGGRAGGGRIPAARARGGPAPGGGVVLSRGGSRSDSIAGARGGVTAGDPRRYCDVSNNLAVVVAAESPEPVLDRFAALPQIVTVLERGDQHAVGVTVDGVPVEVVVAPSEHLSSAHVRETGSEGD